VQHGLGLGLDVVARPVLPLLADGGVAIEDRGVLSPDTNFIQKPFTPDDFTRKVREVLDQPVPQTVGSGDRERSR
jgi:hypothetical protein